MTKRQYSGDSSQYFWDRVNSISGTRGALIYTMAVILQNIEGEFLDIEKRVLGEIESAENHKRKTTRSKDEK